jgi:hypothetical protein
MDRPYVNLQLVQAKSKTKECPDTSNVSYFLCITKKKWNLDSLVTEFSQTLHDSEMIRCRLTQRTQTSVLSCGNMADALWQIGWNERGGGGES